MGGTNACVDSSLCYSDIDQGVTKLATRLNSHHPLQVVDFTERHKDSTSNPVQDIDP
jgi:hypothetical protein